MLKIMAIEQLITPRVDEREWVRLQEELAYLFAKSLRMPRWQYVDNLPIYTPQPVEYRDRFDTLVLIQPPQPEKGLPFKKILDILGLSCDPEVLKMEDWQGDRGKFRTPAIAYATWLEDGSRNVNVKPAVVRENLSADERGGTGFDGVFLYVADRGVLRRHYLDLPGSQVGAGNAPCLGLWGDGPEFNYGWVGYAGPSYGSVVAGRKIVTK